MSLGPNEGEHLVLKRLSLATRQQLLPPVYLKDINYFEQTKNPESATPGVVLMKPLHNSIVSTKHPGFTVLHP